MATVPSLVYCTSFSALSRKRQLTELPGFKGLKLRRSRSLRSVASRSTSRNLNLSIVSKSHEASADVTGVTESTWQPLVLDAEIPVLVEFWAPWCGPCRMIHPVVDELAKEYAGKLKCYKVNTDESPSIATNYGIRSVPTVMIFKNGEKKDTVIGAVPKSTLTKSIDKFL